MERETVDIIVRFFVLTVSLTVHEFAHAWSAYRLGDDTAARMGRMTLNPFSHLDPIGSLLILVGPIGWARPVPVDTLRLRNPRRGGSLVALAGPVSNLLLGFACVAVFSFLNRPTEGVAELLSLFVQINFMLAIFNLLPLYPLDGSKVLPLLLPGFLAARYEQMLEKWRFWPLLILFLPPVLGFRGPLFFWFNLWDPILSPVFRVFHASSFWQAFMPGPQLPAWSGLITLNGPF